MSRDRIIEITHTALRIIAGAMFLCHGLQKLFGVPIGPMQPIGSQLWIGGVVELTAGTLIALGLHARLAAFIASGQMAVAYFQFHWKLDFSEFHWLPLATGADDTVLYCFVFLWLSAAGPGRWSIDAARGRL